LNRTLGVHLSLLLVALIYGAVFTLAKEVMPVYAGAFAMIVLRIGVSMLLFLAFHSLFIREKIHREHIRPLIICAVTGVGVNMLLFFKGLSLTRPINGGVLMMFTPIFVVVFDALINKKRIGARRLSGIALACLGAVLLVSGAGFSINRDTLLGDIYVIINAIIYGFYLVYAKRLAHVYHPFTISKWTFLFGTIFVLPFGFTELSAIDWKAMPAFIFGAITFIVIGSTFITYLLNSWALQYAPSSLVSAYIYLQPIFAMLIAVLAGRDFLSAQKLFYALLIFAGVYLVSMNSVKPKGE
jgi:drug/metabolite transporter (DMT)-like permease